MYNVYDPYFDNIDFNMFKCVKINGNNKKPQSYFSLREDSTFRNVFQRKSCNIHLHRE